MIAKINRLDLGQYQELIQVIHHANSKAKQADEAANKVQFFKRSKSGRYQKLLTELQEDIRKVHQRLPAPSIK